MSSLIGQTLGQYEITGQIGKGGMATVYKAHQASINRDVAIKVLPPHPGLDDQFIERFKIEAKTIGGLQHPHILPIIDYGEQDGVLYLVMAYAGGGSLHDVIARGPLPARKVGKVLTQVAGALDYAHRQNVVHRDIKPGNILLDLEGNPLLADFGIVRLMSSTTNLTGTNIVGTPAYMSPEQAQGIEVDGRADIYALGAMVYEMLTGDQPFHANTPMQVIFKHVQDPVPDLADADVPVPLSLDPVIKRAMAKNPDDRYQTATAFAEAFMEALGNPTATSTVAAIQAPANNETLELSSDTLSATGTRATQAQPQTGTMGQPSDTASQTIIMRQQTNPLVLLGGFLIIAVAIIVGALLLMNNRPGPGDRIGEQATTVAGVATSVATQNNRDRDTPPPINPPPPPREQRPGLLRFRSLEGVADGLTLEVRTIAPLSDGQEYHVWLLNTLTDDVLPLGELQIDPFGDGTLSYTDEDGTVLAAQYNAAVITRNDETNAETLAQSDSIQGQVMYSGSVPYDVTETIRAVFVTSDDGLEDPAATSSATSGGDDYGDLSAAGNAGTTTTPRLSLLESALEEATLAVRHSGLAADSPTVVGMRRHAEHTLNILNGTSIDHDADGRPENPGRGVGIYFFLDAMDNLLIAAISTPDISANVQRNAENILVCLQNVRDWSQEVVVYEEALVSAEDLESVETEKVASTRVMNQVIDGVDANQDGRISQFEGECGLRQIPEYGVVFGNIELVEGTLDADTE